MALVKCKECGKEISSTVKVCPSCGYKKKPSKLTYFIVIVIGFIVGYMYLSNKHDYSSISERTQEKQQTKSIFNELESNIFRAFVENEEMFIEDDGKSGVVDRGLLVLPSKVTADKFQRDYEKNEVKADSEYKNKTLLVTGKVESIQKDAFNNLILKLAGGTNMFLSPSATVKKEYTNWVSTLNKGNNVKLVCTGKSFIVGMATLDDCVPFISWIKNQNIGAKLLNEYSNNPESQSKAMIEMIKSSSLKIDPANSSCNTATYNREKCLAEVLKAIEKEKK
ncbi:zinc-ribbon domain-containing protein [Aliarcobacter cryaerophilus]|uniref:OB-fold protein n=1 Tax=Aliarcobacter cryaerophilus TaxID=28198 RepID=UPI003DA5813F